MNADDSAATPRQGEGPADQDANPGLFAPRGTDRAPPAIERRVLGWDNMALTIYFVALLTLELQFFSGSTGFNFGNVIVAAASAIAAAFAFGTRRAGKATGIRLSPQDYAFALLLAYFGFTSVVSPVPVVTVTQTVYLAFMGLAGICLSRVPVEVAARLIVRICFVLALIAFVMIVIMPSLAFQPASSTGLPELRGIFKHQLRFGLLLAIGVAFMVIAYLNGQAKFVIHQKTWIAWLMFAVISICMVATLARSNIAFMLLALPLSLGLSRRSWIRWATLIGLLALVAVIIANADVFMDAVADDSGQVSLSGRTLIWERTISAASDAPWLGHGYATFDNYIYDYLWREYRPPHAHNSLLNAYFETGLVGVFLVMVFVAVQFISVLTEPPVRRYSYALFLVIITFLSSLMGVVYAGKPSVLFGFLLVFVASETARAARGRRQNRI